MVSPSTYDIYDSPAIESAYDVAGEVPDYDDPAYSNISKEIEQAERATTMRYVTLGLIGLAAVVVVGLIGFFLMIMLWYNSAVEPWRDEIAALENYQPEFFTARIMDAEGGLIAELNSGESGARTSIPLEQMSPFIIHAVVSSENERFYQDPGFDIAAVLRAFFQNLSAGTIESGASTITQQLARNLVLQDTEVTAQRKVNEIVVALAIAERYSKNEILELYLNEVFFGNQSYGVEAASQFYFGHGADELNMAESAMLASLIQAPAANDPVRNRPNAVAAMRDRIQRMISIECLQFQHGIWADTATPFCINEDTRIDVDGQQISLFTLNAQNEPRGGPLLVEIAEVEFGDYAPREVRIKYPHFVNYVESIIDQQFGAGAIFQRGFTIHTTLIPGMQDRAEAVIAQQVANLAGNGVNTGAAMITDPTSGAIRAMVGSHDFSDEEAGQVNNTIQYHQPGSTIKPVVYSAALEGLPTGEFMTPATILWDVPSSYQINNTVYSPVNFDRQFHGPTPLRNSLQNSFNVPAVKAYAFIGNQAFTNMANRLGLEFREDAFFSLPTALGATEVRLFDMMEAYGTFANRGQMIELYAIERITETIDGVEQEVFLPVPRPEPQGVISEQLAFIMQNILSDDQARAGEFGLNSNLTLTRLGVPTLNTVSAKTGTSDGGRDLWTMGFTRSAVVGVWLGTHDDSDTFNITGFTAVAPAWNQIMEVALAGRQPPSFSNPQGVIVQNICRTTGTLDFEGCPNRVSEPFINGKFPPSPEQGFVQQVSIDSWSGLRANEWCQENIVVETFANIQDPFAVTWINDTTQGQQYAQAIGLPLPLQNTPANACQQGMSLPTVRLNNPTANQTIVGTLTITGQVMAQDFNRYELEYAAFNTENFQQITTSTQQFPNAGSTLGTWETTTVPNGAYVLRLTAFSNTGGFIVRDVVVNINNVLPTATPTLPAIPTAPVFASPLPFDSLGATPIPFDND